MKKLGGILISALVLVLTGFVIFSVGTASLGTNKNNVAKNITLSIKEARELVYKACIACGVDESALSTAALKTQSATERELNNLLPARQFLLMSKIVLEQGGGKNEGFVKECWEGTGTQYFGYRLLSDGVEVDIGQDMNEEKGYQDQRIFCEIHYLDANKETWQFSMYYGEENNEFGNKTSEQRVDEFREGMFIAAKGKNFDLLELSADNFGLTKSVYSDDFSVSDIDWAMYLSFDYTTTPNTYGVKIYGATQEKYNYVEQYYNYPAAAEVQNYTTEELNQALANYRQKLVNAYSPNFYEVTCIEYDVMVEVNHTLGLN